MPEVLAYTVPASTIVSKDYGCVALLCGTIGNETGAIDSDPASAATISPSATVSSAALRVGFGSTVPVGSSLKLLVSFSGGGLNAGLLGQTSISTYASTSGAPQQSYSFDTFINVNSLNNSVMTIEFPVTAAFSQVEVRTGGSLNVLVGSYNVSLYQATATVNPLPVELAAFGGASRNTAVDLSWRTATERNSAYFVVERSASAAGGFVALGKVAAAGTSSQPRAYRFTDAQPLALGYYRLQQVDADGTVGYSPIVAVAAKPQLTVQAYPNPAGETITVAGPAGTRFALLNELGQVVRRGELGPLQACALDLRSLPTGAYCLRTEASGATVRVLKAGEGGH